MDHVRLLLVIIVFGLVAYLESHHEGIAGWFVLLIGVLAFVMTFSAEKK